MQKIVLVTAIALMSAHALPAQAEDCKCAKTVAQASAEDIRFMKIVDAEDAWRSKLNGDLQDFDGTDLKPIQLPDVRPETYAKKLAYWQNVLNQLDGLDAKKLSKANQLNLAVFRPQLQARVNDILFREYEMPLDADSQFWANVPFIFERRPKNVFEYKQYIDALGKIPEYFDVQEANMRAGLARGFSVPRATLDGRDQSIAQVVETKVETSPFYAPFLKMPTGISAADAAQLQADARKAITSQVIPAYAKLLKFFREDYLPHTRTTLAAEDLPDGKAFYAAQIKEFTTLDLSADQIHQIGLEEVAKLRAEMDTVMKSTGFKGDFKAFLKFLRTDPQFYAKTPQDLLDRAAWISKRVDGQVGKIIGTLPRGRFEIVEVPPEIAPFWTAGRGGGGRYWLNTYNLPSRPLYNLPALTLHESVPGHSLQTLLVKEMGDRPKFRQAYVDAYGEGWGLYSEWLGKEMGIYQTPYEEFGRLTYAMWRACRLVIDTGVHHKHWSREQAQAFLRDNTALSEHEVVTEVDRYISWPAQALAYKLGDLTIMRLRREAEAALGTDFDVKGFHDAVLSEGSVPLPVLETLVRDWVASEKARLAQAAAAKKAAKH